MALVRARIAKRMRSLNLNSYEDYLDFIRADNQGLEIEQMLDAISTNTTQFYREPAHYDYLREVLADWLNQGMRRLRIWSAASSSGEEPYTLAMETMEVIESRRVDFRLLATDLAPSVLKIAIKGEYADDKVEPIPTLIKNKYFNRIKTSQEILWQVRNEIKSLIIFRQFNLSVVPYPLKNPIDIIFCRNVMIYFDRQVRSRLVNEFYRLLRPGGYLFVGHAESITGLVDGFKCLKPSVYRKE